MGNGGGLEMRRSIFVRAIWLKALNIYRSIFHEVVIQGGSVSFFRNYEVNIEQTHLYTHLK